MNNAAAADLIVFMHLLYVLYTVGGELLILIGAAVKWRWIRNRIFRIIHILASLLVAVEALVGAMCPLTSIEYILRERAGQSVENDISFIGRIIRLVIFYEFPAVFFTLLYVGFAAAVALTYLFIRPYRLIRPDKQKIK